MDCTKNTSLHSTETALLRVKHDIAGALDRNQAMMFVMLDLSASFDTIDHAHLLKLLQDENGVRGTALTWFRTYMEDRTYRVQIDSTTSERIPLHCGVSQGSVLGPVMFTLYTTLMQRIFRRHGVHYHKYADDIQLYASYNPAVPGDQAETVRRLTDCIREVTRWMTFRMLKLNYDKIEMIIFISKHHLKLYGVCSMTIGADIISPVDCVRNLGVLMDQHLTTTHYVTAVCVLLVIIIYTDYHQYVTISQ